jgi:DNA-damage-inducible protein J
MEATTAVQIRIKTELKEKSEKILQRMGLNISDGLRLFLQQVVNSNGLPFQLTVNPNAEDELKRLKRLMEYDRQFAEIRAGNYVTLDELLVGDNANSSQ